MAHYDIEFGGGLGDVFAQCYHNNSLNLFADMGPEDTATVFFVCSNPFAGELFTHHPRASQIKVHQLGYWSVEEDAHYRTKYSMPASGSVFRVPYMPGPVRFFPWPEDRVAIERLDPANTIVVAASAGLPDRNIPSELLERIVTQLLETTPYTIAYTGRTFDRHGRVEVQPHTDNPRVVNLIDVLSVPGTAQLVQWCRGLVTSHSALNLLGWHENKPQLLLYPPSVLEHHCRNGRYDQWMFGADRTNTQHGTFEAFDDSQVQALVANLQPA